MQCTTIHTFHDKWYTKITTIPLRKAQDRPITIEKRSYIKDSTYNYFIPIRIINNHSQHNIEIVCK